MKSTTVRKNSRKAFTIVEIVIVIAVIAILAAILIPTFAHIISKANLSADQQLVNNLNKILRTEEALEGKNLFMHDAILDLADNGYELDALKMSDSDNILIWDQRYDCFIIVEETVDYKGGVSYDLVYCSKTDESKYLDDRGDGEQLYLTYTARSKTNYWKIYTEEDYVTGEDDKKRLPNDNEQEFSIYWGGTGLPSIDSNGIFEVGLDLGYCTEKLEFTGGTEANKDRLAFNAVNTRVRGNINHLQFNSIGAYHIGNVDTIVFNNLQGFSSDVAYITNAMEKDTCHHEFGTVGEISSANGEWNTQYTLVAESGSKFGQTEDAIKTLVKQNFENKGCEFEYTSGN